MNVLITGSNGFIGKNLLIRLSELTGLTISEIDSEIEDNKLKTKVQESDLIFHLAGKNRTDNLEEFKRSNTNLTKKICEYASDSSAPPCIIYTSSTQAEKDNPYGKSKLMAEKHLIEYSERPNCKATIYRLTNVFGKWCKPNYNSVVATFCNNVAKDKPIDIHDPMTTLNLVYIDDVVEAFIKHLKIPDVELYQEVRPIYNISLQDLVDKLHRFKESRNKLEIDPVGAGFDRALYATYISYLEPKNFNYTLASYDDDRGTFVEVLKTKDSGQFSFFTAYPGITRGGHYHHTKNEKFLVLQGKALFRFKNLITGTYKEIVTSDQIPEIVDTVPGWTHDITNIGESKLIVMLWANEKFNQEKPDTYSLEINK